MSYYVYIAVCKRTLKSAKVNVAAVVSCYVMIVTNACRWRTGVVAAIAPHGSAKKLSAYHRHTQFTRCNYTRVSCNHARRLWYICITQRDLSTFQSAFAHGNT